MPDVMAESYRADYDDAIEVGGDGYECEDVVGVATFSVDRHWGGMPTGAIDHLPIRVYVMDPTGDATGEEGKLQGAYLTLESARELRDAIDAAIIQVELTRHQRRRSTRP